MTYHIRLQLKPNAPAESKRIKNYANQIRLIADKTCCARMDVAASTQTSNNVVS